MPSLPTRRGISRRTVLAGVPLVQISALTAAVPSIAPAFTPDQMRLIDAVVNRLIPSDELGPGAREAGVSVYLERSFAGHLSGEKRAFSECLASIEAAARARHNTAFAQLSSDEQDEFLAAMEKNEISGFRPDSRTFFNRLRQLTLEGMFGDPWYGGNRGFAGWDLIRYPGPRMAVSAEDQRLREPVKPLRTSARGGR
jgi:gluconate 2-dehydrogenase gamma chain